MSEEVRDREVAASRAGQQTGMPSTNMGSLSTPHRIMGRSKPRRLGNGLDQDRPLVVMPELQLPLENS